MKPREARQIEQASTLVTRMRDRLHAGDAEAAHALTAGLDAHALRTALAVAAVMIPERVRPQAALTRFETTRIRTLGRVS